MSADTNLYVSPAGRDAWSGRRATRARSGDDGPFATVARALQEARELRAAQTGAQVTIALRGGTYYLDAPLQMDHRDAGTGPARIRGNARVGVERPLVICAYRDERPVLSGGREISGFTARELNGRTVWVADLPQVASGQLYFRQLFVNDQRRRRPRLPREGFFQVAGLAPGPEGDSWKRGYNDRFHFRPGDLHPWHNLTDVELVVLQVWI